ncbi:hypothetical protein GCM10017607_00070 [Microbacterium thalassium]|nr:hypothetical protein GCM10017607_00070 [Microbacterium thalassium]
MTTPDEDYPFDLGRYSRAVTTASPEAQVWFDRGLNWTYGFNHEEAVRCFERCAELDPECAMAWWGIAYALGPNYNKPWEAFDEDDLRSSVRRTHDAVERAVELAANATPVEQALAAALRARYPDGVPAEDCSIWDPLYADAMSAVYHAHPDDVDVATLYADALMNLTPWQLWDIVTGDPAPGSRAIEARAVLDHALADLGGEDHPGVLHLYIHLMEMSTTPEQAVPIADRLRGLVPDSGHLEHMPTHLDVLCGDYRRVVAGNLDAIRADEKYVAERGMMEFYTLYRAHNYHFAVYGALFLGQSRIALETVARLEESIPEDLLRVPSPPMAEWLEAFVGMRVHVLVRFGLWDELLALAVPTDTALYSMTTALTYYGRGVAAAATGDIARAEAEQRLFEAASADVPEEHMLFNNSCSDVLKVAGAMLAGELAYRRGDVEEAFEHLRRSIDLDDTLLYDEPWGWMQPTRHAYGALLLEQGRVEEACSVYEADLGVDGTIPRARQHPANVWSLHGYHECLRRLGRHGEARIIGGQLTMAKALADVPIEASCFCRLDTTHADTPATDHHHLALAHDGCECDHDHAGQNHSSHEHATQHHG